MLNWITRIMTEFGALGIAFLMLLENVFPPIPSELIMPLAGFVAAREQSGYWTAVIGGTMGSLLGTGLWYIVARRVGEQRLRKLLERHGRWFALDNDDLDRAKDWFERHGPAAVFLCRLVPGIRTFISIPAGFNRMPAASFLAYSAAGTFAWTAVLAFLGYRLGADYNEVAKFLEPVSWIVMGSALVLYLWRVIRWNSRKQGLRRA